MTVTLEPGDHGPSGMGIHGMGSVTGGGGLNGGVAACAAIIVAFSGELQSPKGKILTIGIIVFMSASGIKPAEHPEIGNTFSTLGANP
ncbi:MAG: hypothetical protein VW226_11815 [Rhodospirillaceae bacterium]